MLDEWTPMEVALRDTVYRRFWSSVLKVAIDTFDRIAHRNIYSAAMIINFSYLLLALGALFAVAAAPAEAPAEPRNELLELEDRDGPRPPTIIDGRKKRPRLASKYSPVYDVCPGSIVDSGDWGMFSWYLYYAPRSGGTNCVMVRNRSGGAKTMELHLSSGARQGNPDYGTFSKYAGPVPLDHTNGKCVTITFSYLVNRPTWDWAQLIVSDLACG